MQGVPQRDHDQITAAASSETLAALLRGTSLTSGGLVESPSESLSLPGFGPALPPLSEPPPDEAVPDTSPHALDLEADPERSPSSIDDELTAIAHNSTIAPGADRDAAAVGGALEINSVRRPAPKVLDEAPVDLRALGHAGVQTHRSGSFRDGPLRSGTSQVSIPKASGLKAALLAAGSTLVLAAIVFLVIGLVRREARIETGSVLVTTNPQASCSIAVGLTPKGMLPPGGSLTLNDIPPGRHLISLQCLGFLPYATTVEVKTAQASIVLAPLKKP